MWGRKKNLCHDYKGNSRYCREANRCEKVERNSCHRTLFLDFQWIWSWILLTGLTVQWRCVTVFKYTEIAENIRYLCSPFKSSEFCPFLHLSAVIHKQVQPCVGIQHRQAMKVAHSARQKHIFLMYRCCIDVPLDLICGLCWEDLISLWLHFLSLTFSTRPTGFIKLPGWIQ